MKFVYIPYNLSGGMLWGGLLLSMKISIYSSCVGKGYFECIPVMDLYFLYEV